MRVRLTASLTVTQQHLRVGLLVYDGGLLEPVRQLLPEHPLTGVVQRCIYIEWRLLRPVTLHLIDQLRCRCLLSHTTLQQPADITEVFVRLPALTGFKPGCFDHAGSPLHIDSNQRPGTLTQADAAQQMPLLITVQPPGLQGLKTQAQRVEAFKALARHPQQGAA